MELTKTDFVTISKYIRKICGIELGEGKEYLVQQRLEPVAVSQGCLNFNEFARIVAACPPDQLRDQIIFAITTNETSFFRDGHPFELFKMQILPWLANHVKERKIRNISRKGSKVSILCAGASTGQEPYSLSFLINDYVNMNAENGIFYDDFSIVATDISSKVLSKAIAGEYTDMEMSRGLLPMQKNLYFTKENNVWNVRDEIKRIVEFRRVNFIEPFTHLGGFDVIFCRNILIYFDDSTKNTIIRQFHEILSDDGYLILGSTENMVTINTGFESHHIGGSMCYRKKNKINQMV